MANGNQIENGGKRNGFDIFDKIEPKLPAAILVPAKLKPRQHVFEQYPIQPMLDLVGETNLPFDNSVINVEKVVSLLPIRYRRMSTESFIAEHSGHFKHLLLNALLQNKGNLIDTSKSKIFKIARQLFGTRLRDDESLDLPSDNIFVRQFESLGGDPRKVKLSFVAKFIDGIRLRSAPHLRNYLDPYVSQSSLYDHFISPVDQDREDRVSRLTYPHFHANFEYRDITKPFTMGIGPDLQPVWCQINPNQLAPRDQER